MRNKPHKTFSQLEDEVDAEDSEEETEKSHLVSGVQELTVVQDSPSILKRSGQNVQVARKVGVSNPQPKSMGQSEIKPTPRARQQHTLFGDPEKGEAVDGLYQVEAVKVNHVRCSLLLD